MDIICLDLEGTLVPEIWISFSEKTGIGQLKITTRDEPDYDKLMRYRMDILRQHHLGLKDIQEVIGTMAPLEGAKEFLDDLRRHTQVVILSDTFSEFAGPLMQKLGWPMIMCNSLRVDEDGMISDYVMRLQDGKRKEIQAFKRLNYRTFAAGDSYNDLTMIHEADGGCLFRAPQKILEEEPGLQIAQTYGEFATIIRSFLAK
ncbi:MAG: bifunctional phosphoserine phosphatase/homoserine phosphotransferase ThrH [Sphaerochaetaceae bacterium]|jgi:phosphoserine/homoserine phosphotransferase|nr:bifunctional phosphoserine phosphatase/homoserine phosphotransferase ThrH [Spirochaetaceae bacterium]MDY6342706.1 bifunctional phosphoserine phosphatase/homoserine phosphotransferase ThrH [Sphaerochaetaceae bacterium]